MKKELSKVRESRVLFESPEPLFGDMPPRRKLLPRLLAFCILLGLIIGLWALTASGAWEGGGSESREQENTEAPTEKATEGNSENHLITEPETENETENETESISETKSEPEPAPEIETMPPVREVDMSELERGDEYVVSYTDKLPDIKGLLDRGFVGEESAGSPAPLIMIIHTHTSEQYIKNATPFGGVAAVGDALSARLNALGLNTLHCTVIHDGGKGNAYLEARKTIKTMLKIYPSIKYVIDLHRMELELDGAPVKAVSGEKDGSAQIRLTVSADSGRNWQESLSLALSLRQSLNRDGARLCMPTVISQSRYNSDLSEYYIMADIGASGNSVSEARAAALRLANAIADTILKK